MYFVRRIFFCLTISLALLFWQTNTVIAGCTCANWACGGIKCKDNYGCTIPCWCTDPGTGCGEDDPPPLCAPGSYRCNRDGGSCCEMDIVTPIPPNPSPGPDPDPNPGGGCTVTAATNLVATMTSPTSIT
jgi:hypothetical protein